MTRARERWVAVVAALVVAAVLADAVLLLVTGTPPTDRTLVLGDAALAVGLAVAATAIVRRQPGNRLAVYFLAIAVGYADYLLVSDLAEVLWQAGSSDVYPWLKLTGYLGGEIAWPMMWLIGQVYPDGRPVPGRPWAWLWRLSLAWLVLGFVTAMLNRPFSYEGWRTENPLAVPAMDAFMRDFWPGPWFALAVFVGSLLSLVVRYRRARGAERQQMKVFVVTLVVFAISIIAPGFGQPQLYGEFSWRSVVAGLGAAVIPIGLGLAVLRWRLWEVDRLVSRTLGYALTSGALLGAYVLVVTLATRLVPVPEVVAIALAVLASATVFHPLRRRVQRVVDHGFNRTRVDADVVLGALRASLLDSLDEATVRRYLVETIDTHLRPTRTAWVDCPAPAPRAALDDTVAGAPAGRLPSG